jgi:hypothetical protein
VNRAIALGKDFKEIELKVHTGERQPTYRDLVFHHVELRMYQQSVDGPETQSEVSVVGSPQG